MAAQDLTHTGPRRPGEGPPARRLPRALTAALLVPLVLATAGGLVAGWLLPVLGAAGEGVKRFEARLIPPGETSFELPVFPQRSTVYAADGSVLAILADENRRVVPLKRMGETVTRAVLAVEDDDFYERGPIDVWAILRAALANLRAGRIVQGGSTIAQQLVKNTVTGSELSFARKFREAQAAIKLESTYSKDQILEAYLNQVYFGHGAYGVASAAEYYFAKRPRDLELHEAALLAGLIQAPAHWDPVTNPEGALARRNHVLRRMLELGWIDQAQYGRAVTAPLELSDRRRRVNLPGRQPYFVRYVQDQILHPPPGSPLLEVFGEDYEQRRTALFQGGLKIYTTLVPRWQRLARAAVERHLPNPGPAPPADPQAAVVSVVPQTGAITVMYGGRDFSEQKFNLATQSRRGAGSAFKVFTLVAALENGISPRRLYSSRSPMPIPGCVHNEGVWTPGNAEPGGGGMVDLWTATAHSINVVFAQLIRDVGPEKVVEVARRMGITGYVPPYCAITLGAVGVSPLDMASGYATLANGGVHCQPFAITRIEDSAGRTLFEARPRCRRAVSKDIAHLVTAMLERVVSEGTGVAADIGRPQAGKTGTGQDYADAWFVGYVRQLATAVWVGYSRAEIPMDAVYGNLGYPIRVFGGTFPARIWHDYMAEAVRDLPVLDFPEPPAPKVAEVPDVVGLGLEEARKALEAAGFSVLVNEVPSLEAAGTVVAQRPLAGSSLEVGSTVVLDVSNGKAPRAPVPDVTGLFEEEARSVLEERGFVVQVVDEETEDPALDGVVVAQEPAGGAKRRLGSTVTLVVARLAQGPPEEPPGQGGGPPDQGGGGPPGGG
ncbi:MAG TPA: PBP1A family penicillin-binding protein [Actinomycetota bacterium]|nr:PBP1A family penicillin-binding protein [Actinomycetota bacterium]